MIYSTRLSSGDSDWQATLGTKMHKAFMAKIREEMYQAGVAHHANKCYEYFYSHPVPTRRSIRAYRQ